jgi:DNA-binding NtrC family response regulator
MGDAARETATDSAEAMMHGSSAAMREVRARIRRVATSDVAVLLTGESGSGKELAARMVHECSARAGGPIITVDCGTFAAPGIETELFGHEGDGPGDAAGTHPSAFERAGGGTLFLDDITGLPAELQTRLLRVLETGRLCRAGGKSEVRVDVRIVAATQATPAEAVRSGRLRAELHSRLAVFPIMLPPLRERGDDALEIAQHMIDGLNAVSGRERQLSAQARAFLRSHVWPGNVRELRACVERGYLLSDREVHLAAALDAGDAAAQSRAAEIRLQVGTTLEQAERALIEATLWHLRGNKSGAAQTLGCSLKTLYNKLNSYAQLSNAAGA